MAGVRSQVSKESLKEDPTDLAEENRYFFLKN